VGTPGDTLGDADKALAVLVSTLPGKPLVYNGQELGWEGRIKGSKPAWNQPPDPVLDFSTTTRTAWYSGFYKRLLTLYQAMPQERNEVLVKLSSREDCRIYAFLRRNSANRILVLLNLSAEGATYSLSDDALAGDYKDLFSGASLHIGPTLSGSAAPWEYHVYVSGPQTEAAVAALASETPVAPTWDSKAPVSDKPCPTPVQIATPVAGRVPYQAVCGGSRPEKGWQKVDRLVIGINPDRVSARFKASWSEKSLDLQVEVQDPSVNNNLPNPWDDSSVEVYFNMSDSHAGNYGDGDFQYIFTFGRPDPFEAHQKLAGVTCTSSKTPGTWNIQASIPWSTLGVKPQPKKKYGFDLSVDYNQDGSGRQGQLTWHGSADDYHDTSLFSDLVLLPCR